MGEGKRGSKKTHYKAVLKFEQVTHRPEWESGSGKREKRHSGRYFRAVTKVNRT